MNTFLCIGVPSQIFIIPIIALGQQVDTVHGFTRACIVTPFLSKVRVVAFIKGISPPTHPYIKQFRAHVTNMEMCSLTLIIIMKWHFLKCPAFFGGGRHYHFTPQSPSGQHQHHLLLQQGAECA